MSKDTIIRDRTIAKELRLACGYTLTSDEVKSRGYILVGSAGEAGRQGYLTIRQINNMGTLVFPEEIASCHTYAMIKSCPVDFCIKDADGRRMRPCIPVFQREKHLTHNVRVKKQLTP